MVPQSHPFQNFSFQMFQHLNVYVFPPVAFQIIALNVFDTNMFLVPHPCLCSCCTQTWVPSLLSVCQLCCGSLFLHEVNIYWASVCATASQAHQDSRGGCSPQPAGRLWTRATVPQVEEQKGNPSQGRESTEGPGRLSTVTVRAKGPEVGMTGALSDRDPKSYKQLLRAGRQRWARQTAEGWAPAQAGLLPIPEGLLGPDSCPGLRLEWTVSTTLFNTQFSNPCAQRNMPSWTLPPTDYILMFSHLAPKCGWNR